MLKKELKIFGSLTLFVALATTLFANDKVIHGATLEWGPYIGKNIPENGYVAELMKEAFKRMGYRLEFEYMPWARTIEEAKACKYDVLFPEYMNEERKKDFYYTDKYPGGPVGFYKKKDKKISWTGKVEELKGLKIGTVRGYVNPPDFESSEAFIKESATDDETNIKKLEKDRLDLIIVDKFVATYIINTKYPAFNTVLEFMEPALKTYDLYTIFPKKCENSKSLVRDYNRILKEMNEDGTIDKVLRKYDFKHRE